MIDSLFSQPSSFFYQLIYFLVGILQSSPLLQLGHVKHPPPLSTLSSFTHTFSSLALPLDYICNWNLLSVTPSPSKLKQFPLWLLSFMHLKISPGLYDNIFLVKVARAKTAFILCKSSFSVKIVTLCSKRTRNPKSIKLAMKIIVARFAHFAQQVRLCFVHFQLLW